MQATDQQSDSELLTQVAAGGSVGSFERLVERHSAMVLNVCRRQLADAHAAEDAAQAVFILLWRRAHSLAGRTTVAGWLHRTAVNICRNAQRARAIRHKHELEAAEMKPGISLETESWLEIKEVLDGELDRLPEKYRLPIILFHLEQNSRDDVAAALDMKLTTLATRLQRGRDMLRDRLSRRGIAVTSTLLGTVLAANACAAEVPDDFINNTTDAAVIQSAGRFATPGGIGLAGFTYGATSLMSLSSLGLSILLLASLFVASSMGIALMQTPDQPTPAAAVPAAGEEVDMVETPVEIIGSHDRRAIGGLLNWPMAQLASRESLKAFAVDGAGGEPDFGPKPIIAGEQAAVVLSSPSIDTGMHWIPSRVQRQGNTIRVVVDWWTDNAGRNRNSPRQKLYAVALGKIASGEYDFELVVRELHCDVSARKHQYVERMTLRGSVPVVIEKDDAAEAIPSIRESDLKASQGSGRAYQRVSDEWPAFPAGPTVPTIRYLDQGSGRNGLIKPGAAHVYSYKFKESWGPAQDLTSESEWRSLKHYAPTNELVTCLRVQATPIAKAERMTVREIEWTDDRKATVRLDLWIDDRQREAGDHGRLPVLFLPLKNDLRHPAVHAPGDYEITIDWNLRHDAEGEMYERFTLETIDQAPVSDDWKRYFRSMVTEQSRLKFDLRAADAGDKRLSMAVTPMKEAFLDNEPLSFNIGWENISAEPFMLFDADYYADDNGSWTVTANNLDTGETWGVSAGRETKRKPVESQRLDAGKSLKFQMLLDPPFNYFIDRIEDGELTRHRQSQLPPGRYAFQFAVDFQKNIFAGRGPYEAPHWTGRYVSDLVEIGVVSAQHTTTQNGLQLSLEPVRTAFEIGEPLEFELTYVNVSEEAFWLYDPVFFKTRDAWNFMIEPGPWQAVTKAFFSRQPAVLGIGPGKKLTARLVIDDDFHFVWRGDQSEPVAPVDHLPSGEYQLKTKAVFADIPIDSKSHWSGEIELPPVKVSIVDRASTE